MPLWIDQLTRRPRLLIGTLVMFALLGLTPAWGAIQIDKLLADDAAAGDDFGNSVSLDRDRALVGARADDDNGDGSGSAYLYERDPGTGVWAQVAKLLANDGAAGDVFGFSVSLDGDRALVGAYLDDDNGRDSGSAYVFERNPGTETWAQVAKLTADDGVAFDQFGYSVSLDGDRALVGAHLDDDNDRDSGSAYLFERNPGTEAWAQVAKLTANDAAASDDFGFSASLDGDRALVGARFDDDNGSDSGSAYLFERNPGTEAWAQVAKLTADDGAVSDRFGFSVSLYGDRALVGARLDDSGNGPDSGSVYVYERDPGTGAWAQVIKLLANDGADSDRFGNSVSLDGDHALIGAIGDDDNGSQSGSAYLFEERNPGTGGMGTGGQTHCE